MEANEAMCASVHRLRRNNFLARCSGCHPSSFDRVSELVARQKAAVTDSPLAVES